MESQYERSIIRVRKTPSKNDKYNTFGLTIYYEINKPKKGEKTKRIIKKMGKIQKTNTRMFE